MAFKFPSKFPSFSGVQLPTGAIRQNLPLYVGVPLCGVLTAVIMFTGEDPALQVAPDPLTSARPAAMIPDSLGSPMAVNSVGRQVTNAVRDLTADRDAQVLAQRQAELNAEMVRRRAEQQVRADLARARQTIEEYRRTPPVVSSLLTTPSPIITEDEALLRETLRLEELERLHRAPRAAMVVSSARGLSERAHQMPGEDGTLALPAGPPSVFPQGAPTAPAVPGGPAFPVFPSPGPSQGVVPAGFPAAAVPGFDPSFPPSGIGPVVPDLRPPFQPAGPALVRPPGASGVTRPVGGPDASLAVPGAVGGFAGPLAAPNPSPAGVVVYPDDGPTDRIYEGSVLNTVLQTQLSGEFSGPLKVVVNRHFYSRDRRRVLVPRGSTLLGTAGAVSDPDQGRLAIGFHRLVLPDGRWVSLEFGGLNGIGETGLSDQVNRRYVQTFGTAGAIGLLAGFTSRGSDFGTFRSSVADQTSLIGMQILQQHLNRLPEITIRAGQRVNVRFMQDVLLPRADSWVVSSPVDG